MIEMYMLMDVHLFIHITYGIYINYIEKGAKISIYFVCLKFLPLLAYVIILYKMYTASCKLITNSLHSLIKI